MINIIQNIMNMMVNIINMINTIDMINMINLCTALTEAKKSISTSTYFSFNFARTKMHFVQFLTNFVYSL